MYCIGLTQMYLMAAISFERFVIIYRPLSIKGINREKTFIVIAICTFIGLVWSLAPFLGWSYYSLEGALTSCSVEWSERSFNVISYNISIFAFSFLIPMGIIFFTNTRLIVIVSSSSINYYENFI